MPDLFRLLILAAALLFLFPAAGRAEPGPQAREELRDILERTEFQNRFGGEGVNVDLPDVDMEQAQSILDKIKRAVEMFGDLFDKMRDWIGNDRPREGNGLFSGNTGVFSASFATWMAWILVGVIVLLVAILVIRMIRDARREPARAPTASPVGMENAASTENALDYSAEEWSEFGAQWAKKGDLRLALRAIYLGTLVALHRNRVIVYDRNKTNWEYVGEFKRSAAARAIFSELTRVFDFKWYGMEPVANEEYATYQSNAKRLAGEFRETA